MRFMRFRTVALALSLMTPAALPVIILPGALNAQTNTTGAIDGVFRTHPAPSFRMQLS